MDGDLAPLPELFELAERFDAWLVVDDAHGFGVLGPGGRGSLAHFGLPPSPRLILMGTLGKAAGVSGRVRCRRPPRDRVADAAGALLHFHHRLQSRSWPPHWCASLELIAAGDDRRAHLQAPDRPTATRDSPDYRGACCPRQPPFSPCWSVAMTLPCNWPSGCSRAGCGFQPFGRLPCLVGTARLRISLSAAHRESQIDDPHRGSPLTVPIPMPLAPPFPVLPARQRIRQAFDQAATGYDAAADVQREMSDQLATYLRQTDLAADRDAILDAGSAPATARAGWPNAGHGPNSSCSTSRPRCWR